MLTVLASVATFREVFGNTPKQIIISAALPIVIAYFVYIWAVRPAYRSLNNVWNFWALRKKKTAVLVITPPEQPGKAPLATEWNMRNQSHLQEIQGIEERIAELHKDAQAAVAKIRLLDSPTAIKFIEEDLVRIEQRIKDLEAEKAKKEAAKPSDMHKILARVRYFLEHLDELLVKQIDPIKKAQLFGAIFDRLPTYDEIKTGTQKTPLFTGVSPVFELLKAEKSLMVTPRRVELRLPG